MSQVISKYRLNPIRETIIDGVRFFLPARKQWPKFMIDQSAAAAKFFEEHGWVMFRGVFSDAEVQGLRALALQDQQQSYSGEILSSPALGGSQFILDERIVAIARATLKADPCYFGDSTVSIDVRMMGFHKDNPDKEQQAAPDWRSRYSLVRIGLYLQEHAFHSGGLSLRDGSHEHVDHAAGMPLALPTEAGDVVVWSLRTTHSGNALRLKAFPRHFVPIPIARFFETKPGRTLARLITRPMQHKQRVAMFATYGVVNRHLERYLAYLRTRQYAVRSWQVSAAWGKAMHQRAEELGVVLRPMKDEVSGLDPGVLNAKHVYFPWREDE